jgi:multiple antibiotic resistance protein
VLEFGALIFATFGALVPITNPFSTAPVFASLSRRFSVDRRNQQAWMASVYTAATLIVALVAGALIMSFFGISLPALRIAGGLVVARVGFGMLNPEPEQELTDDSRDEAMQMRDIAFTPISMPLLSGPGSIAMTIGMASEASNLLEYAGIGIGIVFTALFAWLVLRSSVRVAEVLGVTGMAVLTRMMGLILVCIGVQFVIRGILETVTLPQVVDALRQAFGG